MNTSAHSDPSHTSRRSSAVITHSFLSDRIRSIVQVPAGTRKFTSRSFPASIRSRGPGSHPPAGQSVSMASPDRAPTGPEGQGGESGGADGASRRAMQSSPPPNPGSLRAMSFRCRQLAHLRPQGREVRLGHTAKVARPLVVIAPDWPCLPASYLQAPRRAIKKSESSTSAQNGAKCRYARRGTPSSLSPRYGATKAGCRT